ncbi:MAG: aldo/keto reductase, partial [Egibacteraceae bacterium]
MDTRTIGSLTVSAVGIGCNNFGGRIDAAATDAVVHAALDAGVTLFDTADTYGSTNSEVFLGKALGSRRDEAVVATKFGMRIGDDSDTGGADPGWIGRAAEDSLRRLGTDHIDLYQLHQPDESTPIEATLDALDRLVRAGKVREVGCSNYSAAQIDAAEQASAQGSHARFVSVQNRYSVLTRDPEDEGVV